MANKVWNKGGITMRGEKRMLKDLMEMQTHFNKMVEAYSSLPPLRNIVRKTVIEDALSVIAVSMDGITQEIADLYDLQSPIWAVSNEDEPTIIEIKANQYPMYEGDEEE
tara:strand:- start:2348 stop:2674 length:327 start_codon:yes stop_codon:yes gene_type:complete